MSPVEVLQRNTAAIHSTHNGSSMTTETTTELRISQASVPGPGVL